MAAFVGETFKTETVASTTLTITPANTAGNLLVLGISGRGSSGLPAVLNVGQAGSNTDPGGNVWQAAIGVQQGIVDVEVWWTLTTAIAGAVVVTLSGSAAIVLDCVELSGFAAPIPPASNLDVIQGGHGSSTAPSTGTSVATSSAVEAVVAFVSSTSTTAFSAQTAGYTPNTQRTSVISGQNITMQSAYKILAATGTQAYGLTAGSGSWGAILVTFLSSGGGGGVALAGTDRVALTGTGAMHSTVALAASGPPVALSGTAALTVQTPAGSTTVALSGTGTLSATAALSGRGAVSLSGTAALAGFRVGLSGTGQLALTAKGGLRLAARLAGTGRWELSGRGAMFFALPYAPGVIGSPSPAIRGSDAGGGVVGSPAPAIRGTGT